MNTLYKIFSHFVICYNNIINYLIFEKKTPILQVFSDFIHSKIFVAGTSGLSIVSTFLGNKDLIIINDETKHSVNDK